MRKWMRRLDRGLLLALVLGLVAAGPFLTRPGLPRQTDAELHVYRAAELGHTLRAGAFYPRWSPDFYYGYGYPIFNYYAPLTYYLANLFDLVPGVDIVAGTKAVFVLGLLLASVGAYLMGRDFFGPAAGVLAAASFTFSPYVVFIDPHARGDLAEHFAICLLPLVFYFFRRLMSGGMSLSQGGVGGRGALLGSVLALAALVFSHALLGLVCAGLLLAYWVWEVVSGTGRGRAGWGMLAFALSGAIIAFYWLPFLMERSAIKLNVIGPGHFDFHEHFLSLGELLAPSRILDMGATAPHYRFNLGLAQWLLALPALAVLLRPVIRRSPKPFTRSHAHLLYFVLAGVGLIFLMLPTSAAIWERIPGMPYLQFPWRLLGPANLMLAVCAASGVALLPAGRWRNPTLAIGLTATLLLALPLLYPPVWAPGFGGTTRLDIIEAERDGSLALGTTSTGDFLPVKAARAPLPPMPPLIESYAGLGPVDRVNRFTLPDVTTVEIVEQGALYDRFAVSTSREFILRLYTFYFPGWRAYVDGEEVGIDVAGPEGFITFRVPAGEHDVLVRFEDTPPRTGGWIIAAAGLVMLILAVLLMPADTLPKSRIPWLTSLPWLGGVLLLFVILKCAVTDPHGWLRYDSPPGQASAAQHEQWASFGCQIELLGYDLPRQSVRPGGKFSVVLYWHALTFLDANYQSFVHMTAAQDVRQVRSQEDHLNPGGLPTTRWPLNKYVWDEFELVVPPDTPPGEYVLNVGIYSREGDYRLQRYDETGQVIGDSIVVASIEVR
ncbi:MAG: hypothetical protein IMY86_08835 [Chloroflexi bacterium]|nr:hypothetical protein [Chloroflexota bacterium]